ncbi:hypothetical protein TH2_187 [Shewanella phage Thanatos-2]|nr:hypothetical protein TH2_187 [Shewanella phage Thanatos-2]
MNNLVDTLENRGYRVNKIFDPVQTHSVNGIRHEDVDEFKKELKLLGAKKLRVVNGAYCSIVCFKA